MRWCPPVYYSSIGIYEARLNLVDANFQNERVFTLPQVLWVLIWTNRNKHQNNRREKIKLPLLCLLLFSETESIHSTRTIRSVEQDTQKTMVIGQLIRRTEEVYTHTHADAPLPWFHLRHCTYRNNRTIQSIDSASTLLRPWCQDKPWQILNFDRFLQRRNAARKWNTKSKNALPTLSRPTALIVCFRFTIWTGNDKTAEVIQITRQWIHGLWLKPPHIPDND